MPGLLIQWRPTPDLLCLTYIAQSFFLARMRSTNIAYTSFLAWLFITCSERRGRSLHSNQVRVLLHLFFFLPCSVRACLCFLGFLSRACHDAFFFSLYFFFFFFFVRGWEPVMEIARGLMVTPRHCDQRTTKRRRFPMPD